MTGPLVVIGDILLDRDIAGTADRLCPDAPVPVLTQTSIVERLGGAGLAAVFAAMDGCDTVLVGAVAPDEAGARVRELLAAAGVRLVEIPYTGPTPEKIRIRAGRHQLLRLDRGTAPGSYGRLPPPDALDGAAAVLVSDYGRGVTALPDVRALIADQARRVPLVWDPHPRGAIPIEGAALVCPNRDEAARFCAAHGAELGEAGVAEAQAAWLRGAWRAGSVAVTMGARGAAVACADDAPAVIPAPEVHDGDSCGAGDRFAATAAKVLGEGAAQAAAVAAAVRAASRYVGAGGPAGIARWQLTEGSW